MIPIVTGNSDMFAILDEDLSLPKGMVIYITDQSHPSQIHRLPKDATPGFSVTVWRKRKLLESMWCRSREQAEQMVDEYWRQYATMKLCRW